MVTYDGAPGELMIGIKEEHHELIGVVVSSYLQKSFVWQCLERCLGVSMNTVGWSKEEHQYERSPLLANSSHIVLKSDSRST